jgi:hypothetical protein
MSNLAKTFHSPTGYAAEVYVDGNEVVAEFEGHPEERDTTIRKEYDTRKQAVATFRRIRSARALGNWAERVAKERDDIMARQYDAAHRNPRRSTKPRVWAIAIKPGDRKLIRAEKIASGVYLKQLRKGLPVGWRFKGYFGGIVGGNELMVYDVGAGTSVMGVYRALRKAKLATRIIRRK